jgi:heme-degrading monooxygenase HmoA
MAQTPELTAQGTVLMYLFVAKSKVDIADIEIFEADQRDRSLSLLKAPGFIQRLVLRDTENLGIYFYISAWKSKADHQGFKADPDVKAWEGSLKARSAHFVELERTDCDIVVEDRATV